MALISLNINLPRYVVEQQLGTAALGIFASLAYAVMAMNLVVGAIGQSASARLARMFAERDFARFRSLIARLVTIGLGLGIVALLGALLLGRWALTVLYTSEYADHLDLLLIMVATAGISAASSFLGYGMTAAHIFRQQLPIIAASTSASYGFSVLLVPYWGLIGAGTALLLSSLIFAFGAYITLSVALRRSEQLS
jgi:O-antigen/teichoic acid export membrane protein